MAVTHFFRYCTDGSSMLLFSSLGASGCRWQRYLISRLLTRVNRALSNRTVYGFGWFRSVTTTCWVKEVTWSEVVNPMYLRRVTWCSVSVLLSRDSSHHERQSKTYKIRYCAVVLTRGVVNISKLLISHFSVNLYHVRILTVLIILSDFIEVAFPHVWAEYLTGWVELPLSEWYFQQCEGDIQLPEWDSWPAYVGSWQYE